MPRYDEMLTFTRTDDSKLQAFYDTGDTQENTLDVIVGIAMKTLGNYTNHIAGTELDDAFAHRAWKQQ